MKERRRCGVRLPQPLGAADTYPVTLLAVAWPPTLPHSLLSLFSPQRSSGAAAGQSDPAAAGTRQHLWRQYYCQGGVWNGVPPCSSDLRSRNGCCGGQDPWEQRPGPLGHYRRRGWHALQAAPTVRSLSGGEHHLHHDDGPVQQQTVQTFTKHYRTYFIWPDI